MFPSRFLAQVAVSFLLVLRANAETHSIQFVNNCGYGSPALMQNGVNILNGNTYTSNGPYSGIAYLQTGFCNTNGENCTLVEMTLINPTCAGCGSSSDLSLILPHYFSVTTSFAYYNGCNGLGKMCTSEQCVGDAFFGPNDNFVQVACQTNDVDLLIAFCADASQLVPAGAAVNGTTSSPTSPTSSLPTTTSPLAISSLPTPSSSLPPSLLPPPSSTPSLESSTPGSVPPVTPSMASTPSTTTPTPAPTQTSIDTIDTGCGGTEPATPSTPIPTDTPCESATSAPTSTPTIPVNSVPPPASPSASPATGQSCRPRPTSLIPSNSAPTTPTSAPTFTPSTTPSATPSAQFRRHRRANRIRY